MRRTHSHRRPATVSLVAGLGMAACGSDSEGGGGAASADAPLQGRGQPRAARRDPQVRSRTTSRRPRASSSTSSSSTTTSSPTWRCRRSSWTPTTSSTSRTWKRRSRPRATSSPPSKPVHIEPLGVYSKKVKSLAELPQGGVVAVPNDPSNSGRALNLLAGNGLITLKAGVGVEGDRGGHRLQPEEPEVQGAGERPAAAQPGGHRDLGDQRQLRDRDRPEAGQGRAGAGEGRGQPVRQPGRRAHRRRERPARGRSWRSCCTRPR